MKTENEIRARFEETRQKLGTTEKVRKAKPGGGYNSGIKMKRILEGERAALAWVLGEHDPGASPTTW
jgi:hypothetical protein